MPKESFILYFDQHEIFKMLSDEQAGQLIKNIFHYEMFNEIPKMDKFLTLAFLPIMQSLDRNKEKYNKIVERNKNNIQKRWNKNNTKNTSGKFGNQKNTKNTDSDNDSDSVYVNDNDNVTTTVVNNNAVSESCIDGLQKIIDFYNNNIGFITPYALEVLKSYAEEMPFDMVIYAMQISVEANKKTIKYIKAILNNWQNKGFKNLIDVKNEEKEFKLSKGEIDQEETEEERMQRKIKELEEHMNANK